ncbi:hypothetical protein LSAT2_017257 [Lamellibrachia satsuma]|nr:hypothetical protein LSAT2_017257 [Lamellibrachia satsuma]
MGNRHGAPKDAPKREVELPPPPIHYLAISRIQEKVRKHFLKPEFTKFSASTSVPGDPGVATPPTPYQPIAASSSQQSTAADTAIEIEKVQEALRRRSYQPPYFNPTMVHVEEVKPQQDKPQIDRGIPFEQRVPGYQQFSTNKNELHKESQPQPDDSASNKATRSLLIVCPRLPLIVDMLQHLDPSQATLSIYYDNINKERTYADLCEGDFLPGLYTTMEVPVDAPFAFNYCVRRLQSGQILATDVIKHGQRHVAVNRDVYYVIPKLQYILTLKLTDRHSRHVPPCRPRTAMPPTDRHAAHGPPCRPRTAMPLTYRHAAHDGL